MPDLNFAPILTLEEMRVIRPRLLNTIVMTSGGYDPPHRGHISCLFASKSYGDTLIAVVNGDWFLKNKKGFYLLDLQTRCDLVASVRGVDFVVAFEIENDTTVNKALEAIQPHIFTKGGDRCDPNTIPEWDTCVKNGIQILTGIGASKAWSSSDMAKNFLRRVKNIDVS